MDSQNNSTVTTVLIVVVLVVIFFTMFPCKHRFGCRCRKCRYNMENFKTLEYNPQSYQKAINTQVINDGFIPLPTDAEYPWSKNKGNYGETEILDDGDMGNLGLNFNLCSKSCCSAQWPTPFSVTPDDFVLRSKDEFVPSSYTCNNGWEDSGCVCLTPKQALFLNRRGNNA